MLFALVAAVLLSPQNSLTRDVAAELADPLTGEANGLVVQKSERLDPPKHTPKTIDGKKWEFDWLTTGFAKPTATNPLDLRFRVYSQERKVDSDVAQSVAMMDVRMWQLLNHKYKFEHADMGKGLR